MLLSEVAKITGIKDTYEERKKHEERERKSKTGKRVERGCAREGDKVR